MIVQQAREYRTQKLKDARIDAQKEVDELKRVRESTFKDMQDESTDTQSTHKKQVEHDTEKALSELVVQFQDKKIIVVDKLLGRVTHTTNQLHRNVNKV